MARQLALFLAAIFGSGCSSSTAPPAFVGAYHAVAVDGAPLPAPIGTMLLVTAATLQLAADGSYTLSIARRDATIPSITDSDDMSGNWSEEGGGGTITLHFDGTSAVSATATYAGDQVTVRRAEHLYTFQRN